MARRQVRPPRDYSDNDSDDIAKNNESSGESPIGGPANTH